MKNLIIGLLIILYSCSSNKIPDYKNSLLPVDQRVEDLLKRMTLEEKVAQLQKYSAIDTLIFDKDGNLSKTQDTVALFHGVGSFSAINWRQNHPYKYWAKCVNSLQHYLVEKSRLGIPAFIMGEALHGYMADSATIFPQAIALGCTWDTLLIEKIFAASALEASARGTRHVLAPVVDLARDPRWGRIEECYSEDPYLVSRMGVAAVHGFQGRKELIDKNHVAVTLKHFAGHGQSEGGRNIAPINQSEREFRQNHLYPFEVIIKEANAQSIMVSYNEWDGIPNHINHQLLTDILRGEWNFKGMVMTDGGGMNVTYLDHLAAKDSAESGILSIRAGIDYDLGSRGSFAKIADYVEKNSISQEDLDRAVRNVLRVKFVCGLFENPYPDLENLSKVTNCNYHKALALEAAQKAIVLLKNEKKTLPLNAAKLKTLAVIGPNAAALPEGGYTSYPNKGISILEGISDYAKNKFKILYSEGCKLTLNHEVHWMTVAENPILNSPEKDAKMIQEAVSVARKSDAVVVVVGENELICREAWADNHLGDRDNLDLVGKQNDLVFELLKTGKPVVVILMNGRPVTINEIAQKAPAVIEGWYLGEETGKAIASILFGDVNPSGKLTVTYPRSVGQLPCYYNHKPSRFRNYNLADSNPLYPFGYGLSYTSFSYQNLSLSSQKMNAGDNVDVSVEITNVGDREGEEIVQLYIHDLISIPVRPVLELKDFSRVFLRPGETKKVIFRLTPQKLESIGMNVKTREVMPGEFEILVGNSSVQGLKTILTVQ